MATFSDNERNEASTKLTMLESIPATYSSTYVTGMQFDLKPSLDR